MRQYHTGLLRPYLLRALHAWIVDNHLTPHVMVDANYPEAKVPEEYVKEGKIILNVSRDAVQNLNMTNEFISFDARFSGVTRQIYLPILSITAIYAVENGRGMVFEHEELTEPPPEGGQGQGGQGDGRPKLKVVK